MVHSVSADGVSLTHNFHQPRFFTAPNTFSPYCVLQPLIRHTWNFLALITTAKHAAMSLFRIEPTIIPARFFFFCPRDKCLLKNYWCIVFCELSSFTPPQWRTTPNELKLTDMISNAPTQQFFWPHSDPNSVPVSRSVSIVFYYGCILFLKLYLTMLCNPTGRDLFFFWVNSFDFNAGTFFFSGPLRFLPSFFLPNA